MSTDEPIRDESEVRLSLEEEAHKLVSALQEQSVFANRLCWLHRGVTTVGTGAACIMMHQLLQEMLGVGKQDVKLMVFALVTAPTSILLSLNILRRRLSCGHITEELRKKLHDLLDPLPQRIGHDLLQILRAEHIEDERRTDLE